MAGKKSKNAIRLARQIASRKRFAVGGDTEELIRPKPYSFEPLNFPKGKELPISSVVTPLPSAGKQELKKSEEETPKTAQADTGASTGYRPPATGGGGDGFGVGFGMSAPDATPSDPNESSWSSGTTTSPTGFGPIDNAIANPAATAVNAAVGFVPGLGLANTVSGLFGGPTIGGMVAGKGAAPISSSMGYSKGTPATSQPAVANPAVAAPPAVAPPMPSPVDRGKATSEDEVATTPTPDDVAAAGSLSGFSGSASPGTGPVGSGIGGMGTWGMGEVGGPLGGANTSTASPLGFHGSEMMGMSVGPLSSTFEGVGNYNDFGAANTPSNAPSSFSDPAGVGAPGAPGTSSSPASSTSKGSFSISSEPIDPDLPDVTAQPISNPSIPQDIMDMMGKGKGQDQDEDDSDDDSDSDSDTSTSDSDSSSSDSGGGTGGSSDGPGGFGDSGMGDSGVGGWGSDGSGFGGDGSGGDGSGGDGGGGDGGGSEKRGGFIRPKTKNRSVLRPIKTKASPIVDRALMVVFKQAKSRRGRPD